MVKIEIGSAFREYSNIGDIEENWINQQVNRRKEDNKKVCVRVEIKQNGVDMALSTPACVKGVGGRPPNSQEKAIFELWDNRGLNDANFTGGNVVAFFKQLRKIL